MQDFLRHAFAYFSPANKKKQKEEPQRRRRRRGRWSKSQGNAEGNAQNDQKKGEHHGEAPDTKNTSLIPVYSENGLDIIGYVSKRDGKSASVSGIPALPGATTTTHNQHTGQLIHDNIELRS